MAALTAGLGEVDVGELQGQAHRLRGSALVLGLDSFAGAVAAYEAALTEPLDRDTARRAADRAARELQLALDPDPLRSVRHDLRNDLNIVLMGSKLLEAELQSDDQRELAAGIAAAAERMASRLGRPAPTGERRCSPRWSCRGLRWAVGACRRRRSTRRGRCLADARYRRGERRDRGGACRGARRTRRARVRRGGRRLPPRRRHR